MSRRVKITHKEIHPEQIKNNISDSNLTAKQASEVLEIDPSTVENWIDGSQKCDGIYSLTITNLYHIKEFHEITNVGGWREISSKLPGKEVKKLRESAKMYQKDLAKLLHLSEQSGKYTISRWESDTYQCNGVNAVIIRSLKLFKRTGDIPDRKLSRQKATKPEIIESLTKSKTLDEAAETLEVHRRTLNRYISKYEIDKTMYGIR